MSRFNGNDARRTIFLPEIGAYLVVYSFLKDNKLIEKLIKLTENNVHSFSPILSTDNTIMRHEQVYNEDDKTTDELNSTYIENIGKKLFLLQVLKNS